MPGEAAAWGEPRATVDIESTRNRELNFKTTNTNAPPGTTVGGGTTTVFSAPGVRDIRLTLQRKIDTGRSGDFVYFVRTDDNTSYMLKVFAPGTKGKLTKDANEIEYHIRFDNLFTNLTPCPKIYFFGTVTGSAPFQQGRTPPQGLMYYLMEAISPPYELKKLLSTMCSGRPLPAAYTNVDLHLLIMQLFYIISKMKLIRLTHCDMHVGNIMIVPNSTHIGQKYNFQHLGSTLELPFGPHLIKIIDFGEGAHINDCRLKRTTTKVQADTAGECIGRGHMARLYKRMFEESLTNAEGDPDINLLIGTVDLMRHTGHSSVLGKFTREDMERLWHLARDYFGVAGLGGPAHKRRVLKYFLHVIAKPSRMADAVAEAESDAVYDAMYRSFFPSSNQGTPGSVPEVHFPTFHNTTHNNATATTYLGAGRTPRTPRAARAARAARAGRALHSWNDAVKLARRKTGIKGVAAKGTPLYMAAKQIQRGT